MWLYIVDSRSNQNKSNNNTAGQSPSSSNYSIKISAWKTLVILSCLATMDAETMLIPAIPDLIREFHVSYSMSSWILTPI